MFKEQAMNLEAGDVVKVDRQWLTVEAASTDGTLEGDPITSVHYQSRKLPVYYNPGMGVWVR